MKIEVPLDDNLRRNMLTSRLTALGEKVYSNTEIKAYANDFVQIYNMSGGYYHHSHGTISGTIIGLYEQHRREYTEQIAVNLQSIINALKEYFEQEKDDTLKQQYFLAYKSVISLNDLVSVELIRLDQVSRQYSSLHQKVTDTLNEANKLSEEAKGILTEAKNLNIGVTQTLERAENLSREADSLKTDVVTILGIFAAVIIAFSGGLSMLGNAISAAVTKTSDPTLTYRLLLVVILCVWGLFNTIYLLLYVVGRLTGKNLSIDCKNDDCKKCTDKDNCKGFRRFRRRSPYVVGFNVLLIIMGGVVILLNNLSLLR